MPRQYAFGTDFCRRRVRPSESSAFFASMAWSIHAGTGGGAAGGLLGIQLPGESESRYYEERVRKWPFIYRLTDVDDSMTILGAAPRQRRDRLLAVNPLPTGRTLPRASAQFLVNASHSPLRNLALASTRVRRCCLGSSDSFGAWMSIWRSVRFAYIVAGWGAIRADAVDLLLLVFDNRCVALAFVREWRFIAYVVREVLAICLAIGVQGENRY